MMGSLLVKLSMLAVTVTLVWSLRWSPSETVKPSAMITEQPTTVSSSRAGSEQRHQVSQQPAKTVEALRSDQLTPRATSPEVTYELLDLNRASANELESLPGIGPTLAQRVIAFRASAGGFRQIDQLREVKGIGTKKFERLKSLVMVSTPVAQHTAKQGEL